MTHGGVVAAGAFAACAVLQGCGGGGEDIACDTSKSPPLEGSIGKCISRWLADQLATGKDTTDLCADYQEYKSCMTSKIQSCEAGLQANYQASVDKYAITYGKNSQLCGDPVATTTSPSSSCDNNIVKNDSDVIGSLISEVVAESKEDCCGKCNGVKACEAWSYAAQWSKCYLKSGFQGTFSNKGTLAGYPAPPADACSNYDVKSDSDVRGNMISEEVGTSEGQCCSKCDSVAACEAWSYSALWSKCYLKSGFQGLFENTGLVAGVAHNPRSSNSGVSADMQSQAVAV